jgi:hypothetical protein
MPTSEYSPSSSWGAQQYVRLRQRGPKTGPGPYLPTGNGNGNGGFFDNGNGMFGGLPMWALLGGAGVLAWFVWQRK